MPAPDKAELDRAYQEAKTFCDDAHAQMRIDDDYFWNDMEQYMGGALGIPSGVRLSIPPKAAEIVLRNLAHIPPDALQIVGLPKPGRDGVPSEEAQAKANKRENWLKGALEEDNQRAYSLNQLPTTLAAAESMLLRGMAVYKTIEDVNAYEPVRTKGEKKEAFDRRHDLWAQDVRFPYPTTVVDPLTIFLSPAGDYVIEERKRYRSEILAEAQRMGWNIEIPERNTTVTWRAHWTPEYVVHFIENEIAQEPIKHGYGFIPFVWGFPGFGSGTLIRGDGSDGLHNIAVSIIQMVRPVILELAFKETQLGYMMQTLAFPRIIASKDVDIPSDPLRAIRYDQGQPPPGYLMPPDKVGELMGVIAKHNDEIDRRTSPVVLGGQMPRRMTTATESMISLGEARLVMSNLVAALEHMEEVRCEHKLRLLEMASKGNAKDVRRVTAMRYAKLGVLQGHKSALSSTELTGKDVEGYYKVKATISVKNPQEEALRLDTELRKLEAMLQSLTTTAENVGIEDYNGERKQMLVEQNWKDALAPAPVAQPAPGDVPVPAGMPVPPNLAAMVPNSMAATESARPG